ncbi:hypothetical protein KUCAC02_032872, partial [Chaenocephalus aceratus]
TESVFSTRLYAPSNSPLQYPIQGFKVRPMTPTIIPGLALHAEQRTNYTVSLKVSKGVLRTVIPAEGARVQGNGESRLMVESSSLETLNELLADVSYASTVYHIHTGDLASFQFEDHEAVFPITIKQPQPPVLYDMGTEGDEMEGGCLNRTFKSRFQSLPGYPQCSVVSGVVNFFLARTDAARRVRFDPKLKRVAHSEFFMDGLGSLMVATCGHVSIGHPGTMKDKVVTKYSSFRHPGMDDEKSKFRNLFFKNHLKCVY